MIDYEKLLIIYMAFIISEEGTSFLNGFDYDKILEEDDKEKLKKIEKKAMQLLINKGLYEDKIL